MNRFGWIVLTMFFTVGVLSFWSSEHRRPAPAASSPAIPAVSGLKFALQMPVAGVSAEQLLDTWEHSRDGGARVHQAIDIPAPMGTPVLAAMAGRIEKLHSSAAGGLTVYLRSNDGRWLTYYAHLSSYAEGLREGAQIAAGQGIAFVGDTGNAGPGNTHLHFAVHSMDPGDRWFQGTPVNPYPLLTGPELARKRAAR